MRTASPHGLAVRVLSVGSSARETASHAVSLFEAWRLRRRRVSLRTFERRGQGLAAFFILRHVPPASRASNGRASLDPVVLTQVGLMMTNVIDTLMLGRVGVTELAASALGNMWQWTFLSFGFGLVMGMDPLVSQAHGRGDGNEIALAYQRGLFLALVISVPIGIAMLFTEEGLVALGQDARTAALAESYNLYRLPTAPCFLVYTALKQYLQGRTIMAPATWIMWIGNVLHLVMNYALVFGNLGMPRLGLDRRRHREHDHDVFFRGGLWLWVRGFGLFAGATRRWDARVVLGARSSPRRAPGASRRRADRSRGDGVLHRHDDGGLDQHGGRRRPPGRAEHGRARVHGADWRSRRARRHVSAISSGAGIIRACAARSALRSFAGVGAMSASPCAFVVFRAELPRLFTTDLEVVALGAAILPIAAAFQLSDGAQGVASGILRGLGRPDAGAIVNLFGYYAVALPAAYYFGVRGGLGLPGVWLALAGGLTVVAALLLFWVARTAASLSGSTQPPCRAPRAALVSARRAFERESDQGREALGFCVPVAPEHGLAVQERHRRQTATRFECLVRLRVEARDRRAARQDERPERRERIDQGDARDLEGDAVGEPQGRQAIRHRGGGHLGRHLRVADACERWKRRHQALLRRRDADARRTVETGTRDALREHCEQAEPLGVAELDAQRAAAEAPHGAALEQPRQRRQHVEIEQRHLVEQLVRARAA